jgi:hypothetical protein
MLKNIHKQKQHQRNRTLTRCSNALYVVTETTARFRSASIAAPLQANKRHYLIHFRAWYRTLRSCITTILFKIIQIFRSEHSFMRQPVVYRKLKCTLLYGTIPTETRGFQFVI